MPASSFFAKYSRQRPLNPLTCAWVALMVLSLGSAVLTIAPLPSEALGGGILLLALVKTRVILARYLDLAESPAWLRGFSTVLAGFTVVIFVLFLI